ncbi:glycosyltransferase [Mycobacterium xenopi]|uniref:Glycosyltransferase n=2 Tax=Mycobacterium xenopi TaxID=1789 RepID=A0AAD1LZE1_MYCXE|nr:glycosyltransferase [Mycobacterium xenopi]MDA3638631.1 glycosyltransferase [Mycobacterium xenopi]MDA3656857.1 glycosyltransferase [Mycobacterium xenopi]MDA3662401.1 glycosyltransferase [Mycobacterium xenopi]ORX10827.1 glycosyl transferase [Mycobacterium xenopi]SPX94220.1 glycosyl transferase [Mycobacterium xenopi]
MKFVLACYGSRGDVEPCVTVGRELRRRGHDVRMAVPPDLAGFAATAELTAVPYGLDTRKPLQAQRDFSTHLFRNPWRMRDLIRLWREVGNLVAQCRVMMNTTLASLADGADLLVTGQGFEELASNVAEYHDIPLATLHYFPARVNSHFIPLRPAPLARAAMRIDEWGYWRWTKRGQDAQRHALGLPRTTEPAPRRITARGSLEIQAYDELCIPGLAAEWAKFDGQRPFVGALTMELPTDADDEVASWIAAGTPPIYFGFGSFPVQSPADTLAMISWACSQLGERALVCAGGTDFGNVANLDHVKVVGAVNHSATFPACRAVVHHGGAGTTAAVLRAGVPQLILWTTGDQPLWGAQIKRLKVGTARRFSTTNRMSLVADLCTILEPQYLSQARETATRMTKPAESVAVAADLVENFARLRRFG